MERFDNSRIPCFVLRGREYRYYRSFENRDALWYVSGNNKERSLGKYKDQFRQIKDLSL